jgi:hypothetical protein
MMLLRCTRKVLTLLDQRPRQVELSRTENGLAEWYVDIVDAFGPTFYLCTNPGTLYTLVLSAGQNDQVADLSGRLLVRLVQHMTELGTDRSNVERIVQELGIVMIAKTANRGVLGSMNDLITHFLWHFSQQMGETGKVDLRAIEQQLNNMPQRPIGWKFAQERFVELCSQS